MRNVIDEPDNLEKLKTKATQIIAENGFDIRGREQPHQLSVQSTQQPTDSFQPKMRGGVEYLIRLEKQWILKKRTITMCNTLHIQRRGG